jgi:hypothetical protein
MHSFINFLTEAAILHIEHPSDRLFDGPQAAKHALRTLKQVSAGKAPSMTRKIDDKMSFNVIRRADGKVGVKYKGTGSSYNFSEKDIDTQHGHKPYLAHPLKLLLQHLPKVIPHTPGEYQGGYMSDRESREHENGKISHTPNTIKYAADADSPEGKALAKSKVSAVIHTKITSAGPKPLTSMEGFGHHPDVHLVPHLVSKDHAIVPKEYKSPADDHLKKAEQLMASHGHEHLPGHEQTLRQYINSTVTTDETPSAEGYKGYLRKWHQKKIDAVKTDKAKTAKKKVMDDMVDHVSKHQQDFYKTLEIHHHLQQATNHLSRGLDSFGAGGFHTTIGGEASGGEGHVYNGLKVVDREGFSKANRARSEILRASRGK